MTVRILISTLLAFLGVLSHPVAPAWAHSVTIEAPSVASGTATIVARTSGPPVRRVELSIDGVVVRSCTSAPCTYAWNTMKVKDGAHQIAASAVHVSKKISTAQQAVIVTNTPDTTPPQITLSAPAVAAGTVTIGAKAADAGGVAKVGLYLDGKMLREYNVASVYMTWDSSTVVDGVHAFQAIAQDMAGNVGRSELINVLVNNLSSTASTSPSTTPPTDSTSTDPSASPSTTSSTGSTSTDPSASSTDTTATTTTPLTTDTTSSNTSSSGTTIPSTAYYVAPWGSDDNPGTIDRPFRTLRRGSRLLTPGGVLVVRAGTYDEVLMNAPWHNGGTPDIPGGLSWDAPVTIRAYPGEAPILKPSSAGNASLYLQGAVSQYIVIDGLVIDGTYGGGVVITGSGDPLGAAHHIRLTNCSVLNSPGDGITISQFSGFNHVARCRIHHNGRTGRGHGLYIATSDNLIENNVIHENAAYGVHLYGQDLNKVNRNIVRNNRIYQSGWLQKQFAIIVSSGRGNQVFNNLIHDSHGGINVQHYNPSDTLIANNTFFNLAEYGIYIGPDSGNTVIRNNILHRTPGITNNGPASTIDHNLINVDPVFANPGLADFRLLVGSPAIDRGATISVIGSDCCGILRPKGAAYDLGAHESLP